MVIWGCLNARDPSPPDRKEGFEEVDEAEVLCRVAVVERVRFRAREAMGAVGAIQNGRNGIRDPAAGSRAGFRRAAIERSRLDRMANSL